MVGYIFEHYITHFYITGFSHKTMFPLLSKCIQRKRLLALKTYISPPRLGYSSDLGMGLGVVGMGWGRGLWDKDDKPERLLKSPPWVELLSVYDGTSVTEFLWEAHLTGGIRWRRRLSIRGVHQCPRKVGENKAQQIHITGCRRMLTRPCNCCQGNIQTCGPLVP